MKPSTPRMLSKMPMADRQAAWKMYRQGRSYTEIAIELSKIQNRFVSRNTIAGLVFRVRHNEKLRIEFDKELFK